MYHVPAHVPAQQQQNRSGHLYHWCTTTAQQNVDHRTKTDRSRSPEQWHLQHQQKDVPTAQLYFLYVITIASTCTFQHIAIYRRYTTRYHRRCHRHTAMYVRTTTIIRMYNTSLQCRSSPPYEHQCTKGKSSTIHVRMQSSIIIIHYKGR